MVRRARGWTDQLQGLQGLQGLFPATPHEDMKTAIWYGLKAPQHHQHHQHHQHVDAGPRRLVGRPRKDADSRLSAAGRIWKHRKPSAPLLASLGGNRRGDGYGFTPESAANTLDRDGLKLRSGSEGAL